MKFQQLSIGQRFEYEGLTYVKVGPLVAQEEGGGRQRLIPRYAVLRPAGSPAAASEASPADASKADAVLAAVDAYHRRCLEILGRIGEHAPAQALEQAREELAAGWRGLIDEIKRVS